MGVSKLSAKVYLFIFKVNYPFNSTYAKKREHLKFTKC